MVKGGAQENTLATAAGLHGSGWDSALITGPALGPEGSLEPAIRARGVRTIHIPELVREVSPHADCIAIRRLTAIFRHEQPHLVHTHTSKAGIVGRVAARLARVPVVVHTPHGHVFHSYESGLKTRLFILAERACAPLADGLVALTERELSETVALGVGRRDRWQVVHSGVPLEPFRAGVVERAAARQELGLRDSAQVIGTVGRLVPIKGQIHLLDAFAQLPQDRDLHLLLVGDGELRAELVARARGLGLTVLEDGAVPAGGSPPRAVHFLGLRQDVPRWLAAMDLFALPSLNEGMGRVLVEAMVMGLPCVGSRVSGIPDVIDEGVTGLLVPARDPAALSTALRALLSDPERSREMGRRGRERVDPAFSQEEMLRRLEVLYRELLAKKGIPLPDENGR